MKIFALKPDVCFTPVHSDGGGRIVSVFIDKGNPDPHNFRCIECGRIVFQYSGGVSFIFDGAAIPEEKAVINILCHRCKIIYRIL